MVDGDIGAVAGLDDVSSFFKTVFSAKTWTRIQGHVLNALFSV